MSLEGSALIEEYQARGADGSLQDQGITLVAWHPKRANWSLVYLGLGATGTPTVTEFSAKVEQGVLVERWQGSDERGAHVGRARYIVHGPDHYRYVMDLSYDDGKSWIEAVMTADNRRIDPAAGPSP